MTAPKLKPCPFCGWAGIIARPYFPRPHSKKGSGYMAQCQGCDARCVASTKEDAIEKWQRRKGVVEDVAENDE